MTPEDMRRLFPATARHNYLNHAGVAPTSTRVRDAALRWLQGVVDDGILGEQEWEEEAERARACAASLLGTTASQIAFVRSTSHGLAMFAEGFPWRSGDEVCVASEIEYPSNVYPWLHLASRGVAMREIAPRRLGVTVEAVEQALSPRTRVCAVSSVQYASGHRTSLAEIGALCRARGVVFVVDGIQSVGAVPVAVEADGIDFLSADSHKWMLGINGVGIAYVSPRALELLRPVAVGWKSTKGAWNFDRADFDLRADAARLEEGSPSYVSLYALGAALGLLSEVGIEVIAARLEALLTRLSAGLTALGAEVAPGREERAGILTFVPRGVDTGEFVRRARERSIVLSLRRGRVRVSPHAYTRDSEIDAVVELVKELT